MWRPTSSPPIHHACAHPPLELPGSTSPAVPTSPACCCSDDTDWNGRMMPALPKPAGQEGDDVMLRAHDRCRFVLHQVCAPLKRAQRRTACAIAHRCGRHLCTVQLEAAACWAAHAQQGPPAAATLYPPALVHAYGTTRHVERPRAVWRRAQRPKIACGQRRLGTRQSWLARRATS